MPTLIQILRELAERRSDEHVTGVADDHTTTSLTDTRDQKFSSADDNELDRKYVYLEAVKMQSRITEAGKAGSSGVLTLSPDVDDAPTAVTGSAAGVSTTSTTLTDTGESMTVDEWIGYTVAAGGLYLDVTSNTATVLTGTGGWSDGSSGPGAVAWTVGTRYLISDEPIRTLKNAIAAVLRNMHPRTFFPLSVDIVTGDDNDMENDPANNYSTSNASVVQTAASRSNGVYGSSLLTSADNGYMTSGTQFVVPDAQYRVAVMAAPQGASATAELRALDVTNGDEIGLASTGERGSEGRLMALSFEFTIPSGCDQLRIEMRGSDTTETYLFDDYQLWVPGRHVYPLPSWITRPEQVIGVRGFPLGASGPGTNDYRVEERNSIPLAWDFERVDKLGTDKLHIVVEGTSNRPFIYALRALPALTSDSGSTPADLDNVVFWAAKYLEAEPQERSEVLATLRSLYFVRPTMTFPQRVGA